MPTPLWIMGALATVMSSSCACSDSSIIRTTSGAEACDPWRSERPGSLGATLDAPAGSSLRAIESERYATASGEEGLAQAVWVASHASSEPQLPAGPRKRCGRANCALTIERVMIELAERTG